jgi:hypothetical protein
MIIKNILLIVSVILLSLSQVNGQPASDSTLQTSGGQYIYCELVGAQKFLSTKINVSVDFGEERGFFYNDTWLRDPETNKLRSFNSIVDALNFMGTDGWEFVQAYAITVGQSNVFHWLLRKPFH